MSDDGMRPERREVERFLESLGEAITDETPVDWDAAKRVKPDLSSRIDGLRTISEIAAAHRSRAGRSAVDGDSRIGRAAGLSPALFRWGHLEAVERLGTGSYGEVFRAFDTTLERDVALKLWPSMGTGAGWSARPALDEARRLARVRHPNVLMVHGADIHDERFGIWTDLIDGKSLEERLASDGPLGAQEAMVIGAQLCRALAAIHAAGLVHGDVKAANVLRESGGRIVLADFGSVSDLLAGDSREGRRAFGTPLAAAPEVLRGGSPTPAADLYGLGVLLYRLVSGRYPVSAATALELLEKHEKGERTTLRDARPDLPGSFVAVVERALEADPRARHASAGAMERALVGAYDETGPDADGARDQGADDGRAAVAGARGRRTRAAPRFPTLAVILLVPLVVAGGAYLLLRSSIRGGAAASRGEPTAAATPVARSSQAGRTEASPARALRVDASLHRVRAGLEEVLPSGALLHTGESLFLRLEGSEPLNLYVLDEDEAGKLFVLFPIAGLDATNPLEGGVAHRIPGTRAGVAQDWEVTSAGGKEWILVIASRSPLPALESEIATMPAAEAGRPLEFGELAPQALDGMRGIGRMGESRSAAARAVESRLAELARRLPAAAADPSGIWVRLFELHNAGS
jgi:hypothetical protein